MKRAILAGVFGSGCLLGLSACVVAPPPPPPPPPVVYPAPAPVVVAPRPVWHRRCPVGWHLGPYGRRCHPNR
jgi:hypothetical protein